jgi:hypothetical protein
MVYYTPVQFCNELSGKFSHEKHIHNMHYTLFPTLQSRCMLMEIILHCDWVCVVSICFSFILYFTFLNYSVLLVSNYLLHWIQCADHQKRITANFVVYVRIKVKYKCSCYICQTESITEKPELMLHGRIQFCGSCMYQ